MFDPEPDDCETLVVSWVLPASFFSCASFFHETYPACCELNNYISHQIKWYKNISIYDKKKKKKETFPQTTMI